MPTYSDIKRQTGGRGEPGADYTTVTGKENMEPHLGVACSCTKWTCKATQHRQGDLVTRAGGVSGERGMSSADFLLFLSLPSLLLNHEKQLFG